MKISFLSGLILAGSIAFSGCHKSGGGGHVPVNYSFSIRPDGTNGQDSWVSKLDNHPADGGVNLNGTHELVIARWSFQANNYDSASQRTYIRFDSLSKVPATATLQSAVLYLYGESTSVTFPGGNSYYSNSSNPENSCVIQKVTGGTWDQSTITWNNAPAATSTGQDTIPASTSMWNYNTSVDVTNLVKDMIATSASNYGFCIKLKKENIYKAMLFSSSEAADSTLRPKLVLAYTY